METITMQSGTLGMLLLLAFFAGGICAVLWK